MSQNQQPSSRLFQPINLGAIDPTQGGASLPVGIYPVVNVGALVKGAADNESGFLELEMKILDGPNAGTTGMRRFHIYHSSEKTVEIAKRQLAAAGAVVGFYAQLEDGQQICNGVPYIVEVGMQKRKADWKEGDPEYTEVKRVYDQNFNEPLPGGQFKPSGKSFDYGQRATGGGVATQTAQQGGGFQQQPNGGGFNNNAGGFNQQQNPQGQPQGQPQGGFGGQQQPGAGQPSGIVTGAQQPAGNAQGGGWQGGGQQQQPAPAQGGQGGAGNGGWNGGGQQNPQGQPQGGNGGGPSWGR